MVDIQSATAEIRRGRKKKKPQCKAAITRTTDTVHTSAKARLTSASIWRISMSSRLWPLTTFRISQ